MKVATWNVNGLRARLEFALAWIRERQPDIVGFQELKLTDDQFPSEAFEALGYHAVTHGQKAWNGVAILSRQPAELVQRGLPGQEDFGARLLTADFEGISFTTLYCPNGKSIDHDDYPRKLAWFDGLADYVAAEKLDQKPAILCGDFNICPTDLDSWNPDGARGEIFHTDAERARMQRFYDFGFEDAYRKLHPETQTFSWWDYRGGSFHRGHGLRIDFILATAPVSARVVSAETDREWRKKVDGLTASDHAPVIVELS